MLSKVVKKKGNELSGPVLFLTGQLHNLQVGKHLCHWSMGEIPEFLIV